MSEQLYGSCLCGAIKLTVPRPSSLQLCHCADCRKFTGAIAAFLLPHIPRSQTTITGYTSGYAVSAQSGATVVRYFCGQCGSSLYEIGSREPDDLFVHAGLFPPGSLPAPSKEVWCKRAEAWQAAYPGAERQNTEVKDGV